MSLKKLLGPICISLRYVFLAFRDLASITLIFIGVNIRCSSTGKSRNRLFPGNASQGLPFFPGNTSEWVSFFSLFSTDVCRQRVDSTKRVLISLGWMTSGSILSRLFNLRLPHGRLDIIYRWLFCRARTEARASIVFSNGRCRKRARYALSNLEDRNNLYGKYWGN